MTHDTIKMYDPTRDYKTHKNEYDIAIQNVLTSGQFINGPPIKELERQLADYCGTKYCIAVSSGTDALLIALMALKVKSGDEVITVPFTWISSAEVISLLGAKPVFVDIEKDTYTMDPKGLEVRITGRTKAIIVVDLFGQLANYPEISKIADKYDIPIIQDFAQSFGAEQNKIKAGNQGIISCTSFFPSKPLGCYGDGGACFTDDCVLATTMKAIRNHGAIRKFNHLHVGLNGRLDSLQAAILLVKLKYFEDSKMGRIEVARRYDKKLDPKYWIQSSPIKLPKKLDINNLHVYAIYTVRVKDRDKLMEYLCDNGVKLSIFYPQPLHLQPVFKRYGYKKGDYPISERVVDEVISLPCYPEIEDWEQRTIISLIKSFYNL